MNYKKLNLTEAELINYCASLNEQELKAFQLECKLNDINEFKAKFKFALINVFLSLFSLTYALLNAQYVLALSCGVVFIFAMLFSFGFSKRVKQEETMFRMLEIWFKDNQIL